MDTSIFNKITMENAYFFTRSHSKRKISIEDFNFRHTGLGQWRVTYTSPATLKSWTATITHSLLMDEILDEDKKTKRSDLELLKRLCKQGGFNTTQRETTTIKPYGSTVKPHDVTQYTVYLTKEIKDPESDELTRVFDFYKVSDAKKFIRKHIDSYKSSIVTKIYSNGDWENLGPINLAGNNKHYIANTRMTRENYGLTFQPSTSR